MVGGDPALPLHRKGGPWIRLQRALHQTQDPRRGPRRLLHYRCRGKARPQRRRFRAVLGGIAQALVPEASRIHRLSR